MPAGTGSLDGSELQHPPPAVQHTRGPIGGGEHPQGCPNKTLRRQRGAHRCRYDARVTLHRLLSVSDSREEHPSLLDETFVANARRYGEQLDNMLMQDRDFGMP